ncbi:MAG: FAD-dependent oxidoreductase, partial [Rhodobacteraceae bacterium]|nr:FAD-dependent oxidoreductase [Paracoccaceae bacterium]
DWSAAGFPWLSVRECFIGIAPATVLGVSFSGELAYEIHIPNASLYAAYLALREAGVAHGMKLFGARAVEAMRMEKGYLHWKSDLLTEFDPFETALHRFVKVTKADFIGKAALEARQGLQKKALVTLDVATTRAAAHGGASVYDGDALIGTVTSGDWGHRTGLNLAYAFVDVDKSGVGTALQIDVTGEVVAAKVIEPSPYDPAGERYRA